MTATVLVCDDTGAATIRGVYGGEGTLLWKRLGTGAFMFADWDSFEWISLPNPGDECGEHLHSETEEIWFGLVGHGTITIDGEEHSFGPDDAFVTPLGSRHNVVNTGDGPLEYLVIEMFPPVVAEALPGRTPDK